MTEQEKASKAAELLVAWADGKKIQMLSTQGWIDYTLEEHPTLSSIHLNQWRLKPEPIKRWYRVALLKYSYYEFSTRVADNELEENSYKKNIHFVKWITERIEYEVPGE